MTELILPKPKQKISLKALRKQVVIKKDTPEETTAGGIVLPDVCKEKPMTGKVLSVGPDTRDVSVDDRVLFPKYGGVDVTIEGEEFYILEFGDIIAII